MCAYLDVIAFCGTPNRGSHDRGYVLEGVFDVEDGVQHHILHIVVTARRRDAAMPLSLVIIDAIPVDPH